MNKTVSIADNSQRERVALACCMLVIAVVVALMAGQFPIQYSIAIVFLFAGPHNWIEAKYFLTKLPPRLGRLRRFFAVAAAGVLLLAISHASLPFSTHYFGWRRSTWELALALWCSLLVGWVVWLVWLRSKQGPRRDPSLASPLGLTAIGFCWLYPQLSLLSLVYLHPLVGFWILDREISSNHRHLRKTYRCCLTAIPVLVVFLAWQFAGERDLIVQNETSMRIVGQVGSNQVSIVSSHFLVATHAFLETLHYVVWLVAIPLASGRVFSLNWTCMPITRSPSQKRRWVAALLGLGAFVVLVLWIAFSLDYSMTRTIYFHVAMLHVLAEVPFLLRQV